MSGEVGFLVGYTAGRIGLLKILKWLAAMSLLLAGAVGLTHSRNAGQFAISVLLLAVPIAWFLIHRKLRAERIRKLYVQAVAEVRQEWQFTQNEQAARSQTAEIARAVGMSPEAVWSDVLTAR